MRAEEGEGGRSRGGRRHRRGASRVSYTAKGEEAVYMKMCCWSARACVFLPRTGRTCMAGNALASVRAVCTFTVKPGQIYAKRSRLSARSIKKNHGGCSSLLLPLSCIPHATRSPSQAIYEIRFLEISVRAFLVGGTSNFGLRRTETLAETVGALRTAGNIA